MTTPPPIFRRTTLPLAVILLTGCATGTPSLGPAVFPAPVTHEPDDLPGDRRLLPFLGTWTVESTIHQSDGTAPLLLTGAADFTPAIDGRSVRERITLDGFTADTTLGFSPTRGRYELTQIDNSTGGQLWLTGHWSADGRTLELEPVDAAQLETLPYISMRWTYEFIEGRLIKTIRAQDADGVWRTQSVYTYSRSGSRSGS